MSKVYTVYHSDPLTLVKKEVGLVLERRKLDRGNNFEGLMKMATRFATFVPPGNVANGLDPLGAVDPSKQALAPGHGWTEHGG